MIQIEEAVVENVDKCHRCGEYHIDQLVWDETGETVTCSTCGNVYRPE